MPDNFDIVIVGGGLVGASLACALADSGLRIAVIDAVVPDIDNNPRFDERTIALAFGASRIFRSIGVWPLMEHAGLTPIQTIHVSDRQHAGLTRLHCEDEGVDALGYIVPMRVMGMALLERMSQFENVTQVCPARVTSIDFSDECARVEVETDNRTKSIETKLVVGADGLQSVVREIMGSSVNKVDYHQHAVIATVATEYEHKNVAYERFTESGPMAVLPLQDDESGLHRSALVWTVNENDSDDLMDLDDEIFLERLQERFGHRLGRILKVGKRSCFPLGLQHAKEQVKHRAALIGNAAHTLHPVAGQGFNLGLRDVAVMAQVLIDAHRNGEELGSLDVLQRYADWRKRDHRRVIGFTDGLVRLFSNNFPPLAVARNIGLVLADVFPPVKRLITRQAMGLAGKLPRISRGLKL